MVDLEKLLVFQAASHSAEREGISPETIRRFQANWKRELERHVGAEKQVAVDAARLEVVRRLMSVDTEGLFDGPDLFIKRAPLEQEMINIIGYEAYKAIKESTPVESNRERRWHNNLLPRMTQ